MIKIRATGIRQNYLPTNVCCFSVHFSSVCSVFPQDSSPSIPELHWVYWQNRTLITQMITSICFLEDAQWGEAEDRANHPTVRKRPGRNKTWKKAGTTFQNHRERARAQCSVIPSLAATEKVNKVFSQIASYVKEPSSTKDNKNDYFLTHIWVGLFMMSILFLELFF